MEMVHYPCPGIFRSRNNNYQGIKNPRAFLLKLPVKKYRFTGLNRFPVIKSVKYFDTYVKNFYSSVNFFYTFIFVIFVIILIFLLLHNWHNICS